MLASIYCCFVGKSAKNLNFKEDDSTGQVWNYIRSPRQRLSSFNVLIKFFLRILFLFHLFGTEDITWLPAWKRILS